MGAKSRAFIGTVYMATLDGNKNRTSGYMKVGNCYPFTVKVETEQKVNVSRMRENAGQNLDVRNILSAISGSLTINQWLAKTLAWALSGEEVAMTEAGGTVTAAAGTTLTAPKPGEWEPMGHQNISAVEITEDVDTTSATYVLGTDYLINTALGMWTTVEGGQISAGDKVRYGYTYAAESGYRVEIGTKTLIRVAILIDGEDEYSGELINAEFDSVVLASGTEINLISDPDTDYEELQFSTTFETLDGKTSPGRINGVSL
ncbi:phage tail tube protein [Desulfogranum japonicum]|uniref:phage tail tube protein n=1 Tax=Desulfogranum japonicum TaxID=231447 RepID=UPI0003F962E8|nr:hypothetical protein [Desulfogranum japonicum]